MKEPFKGIFKGTRMKAYVSSLIILSLLEVVQAEFAGGAGRFDDPYQISDAAQLLLIGAEQRLLQGHYVLINDIDLDPNLPGGKVYHRAPIGIAGEPIRQPALDNKLDFFAGTLDGNGYTIRNLCIESGSGRGIGLFGMLGPHARVSNLRLENFRITARESVSVGLLAGVNHGWVVRCHADGHIVCRGASEQIGGLVGRNSGHLAVLRGCTTSCTIDGRDLTIGRSGCSGGIAGSNEGIVSNCVAKGQVSGSRIVGGLVGRNSGLVVDSLATGQVRGGAAVGGLVGWAGGTICRCYSTGCVRLDPKYLGTPTSMESGVAGGLVGMPEGLVLASFWDMTTSGMQTSRAGTGLTSEQMRDRSMYLRAGWDFVDESANGTSDIWLQQEGQAYPEPAILSSLNKRVLSGQGTSDDPYRIGSPEELGLINHYDMTEVFQLTNDIDLSGCQWLSSPIVAFDGTFRGNGHVIANYQAKGGAGGGLFQLLGRNASVIMVGVNAFEITSGGGLADINCGDVQQCFAKGIIVGKGIAGGLVAINYGRVSDCYSQGDISGYVTVGGVVGSTSSTYGMGTCSNLYSIASVAAKGRPLRGGSIHKVVGGVVGDCGWWERTLVQNCYYLWELGTDKAAVGQALTDSEMKQPASFSGWDCDRIWRIEPGQDYPRLRWEIGGRGQ